MNATELRIGNILADHHGIENRVKAINVGWCRFEDDEACAFDLCSGIPLTEEWLLKAGFSNEIDEELPEDAVFLCFFRDNIDVELQPGSMGGYEVVGVTLYEDAIDINGQLVSEGKFEIKSDIQFVHQFQNLYFALTGQELQFN